MTDQPLGLRCITPAVLERLAPIRRELEAALREQERKDLEAVGRARAAALLVKAEARGAFIRKASDEIVAEPPHWVGFLDRSRSTQRQVIPSALRWTQMRRETAKRPAQPMISAREAEILVQRWLTRILGGEVHDVSADMAYDDGEGLAYKRYDLAHKATGRRFDVKNTAFPQAARHVIGRAIPASDVVLIGVASALLLGERQHLLLGALDGNDLRAWDRFLAALLSRGAGVAVLLPKTCTNNGASVRPSWTFGSPRHAAFLPTGNFAGDPVARVDEATSEWPDAWKHMPEAFRLLSSVARKAVDPDAGAAGSLRASFARSLEELAVDRMELRHLYMLTLADFRRRYREECYSPSVYEDAFVHNGRWKTPGGTWDPCEYYRSLLSGLSQLWKHRAKLPHVIETIHVTPLNTVIANYRSEGDRGTHPTTTLLTVCGNGSCPDRAEGGSPRLLVHGAESVLCVDGGFLRCPACGHAQRRPFTRV